MKISLRQLKRIIKETVEQLTECPPAVERLFKTYVKLDPSGSTFSLNESGGDAAEAWIDANNGWNDQSVWDRLSAPGVTSATSDYRLLWWDKVTGQILYQPSPEEDVLSLSPSGEAVPISIRQLSELVRSLS